MKPAHTLLTAAMVLAAAQVAMAQVTPEIAKQLVNIGRGVCVPETAQIYGPIHGTPSHKGVTILRDQSFGPDPANVVDVFTPEKGGGKRPVLMYVSGGPGNRQQGGPNGAAFYDNVMLWAVKNGMVGVNVQRRPGVAWDDPAKDIAKAVQWVNDNIVRHKGNPDRVFMWAQSAGNPPTSTYIGHPELYGPKGVGVKGVVFMSAANFNILPATPPAGQGGGFGPCGQPNGGPAPATAAAPGGGGAKGGDGKAKAGDGKGKGGAPQPDAATQLARSNLPGLIKAKVAYFITVAELDPPNVIAFAETLRDELNKGGHPVMYQLFKDHSHISEVLSPNTADTSVTGPILRWMKSVK